MKQSWYTILPDMHSSDPFPLSCLLSLGLTHLWSWNKSSLLFKFIWNNASFSEPSQLASLFDLFHYCLLIWRGSDSKLIFYSFWLFQINFLRELQRFLNQDYHSSYHLSSLSSVASYQSESYNQKSRIREDEVGGENTLDQDKKLVAML